MVLLGVGQAEGRSCAGKNLPTLASKMRMLFLPIWFLWRPVMWMVLLG